MDKKRWVSIEPHPFFENIFKKISCRPGLARIELATRGFGDHRSTSELQPYIYLIVQPISLILCLKHDISSKEQVFDPALLQRGSLHWEVVYPSKSNLQFWVEVSNLNYYLHVASFVEWIQLVFVSVALSFELSLSSTREMPPVFQCQDFPNSGYPELCTLIEQYEIYKNQIFFQGLLLLFYSLFNLMCNLLLNQFWINISTQDFFCPLNIFICSSMNSF